VQPHGEDAWERRRSAIGVSRETVEELIVISTPLKPDAWKDGRLGRVNRLIRLPNRKRLLVAIDVVRQATGSRPGAIEIVTLYVQ
jgi:hypothetical protein